MPSGPAGVTQSTLSGAQETEVIGTRDVLLCGSPEPDSHFNTSRLKPGLELWPSSARVKCSALTSARHGDC
jgi:hypothetical protein